jgi:hypothetical protein
VGGCWRLRGELELKGGLLRICLFFRTGAPAARCALSSSSRQSPVARGTGQGTGLITPARGGGAPAAARSTSQPGWQPAARSTAKPGWYR